MQALLALAFVVALAAPAAAGTQTYNADADDAGKLPITTSSEEARGLYLEARHLADELHGAQAYEKYGEAVAADPDFALAHYGRATQSPTAAAFFESLERAVALADRASSAERHMILALQAGANADFATQREHLTQLVTDFPDDERAHFLLGNHYNGVQEFEKGIEHYERAVAIEPSFSPAYNILGYTNRFLGRNDEAERAFKKYIELLPDEPNPRDSYAEFLMRVGRFDESIEQYRKAMELDPSFTPSLIGIGNDQIFLGRFDEARATFKQMYDQAPNDGVRRGAMFWTSVADLHEGRRDDALEAVRKMSAIAEASGDDVARAGDLVLMGNMILETGGSPDEALQKFEEGLATMEGADAPPDVKEAFRRAHLYNQGLVAVWKKDVEQARRHADAFRAEVQKGKAPPELLLVHELDGRVALLEGDVDRAIAELELANQQDPRILWVLSRAYAQKGDAARAAELARATAEWNQLNGGLAFVRNDAREALEGGTS